MDMQELATLWKASDNSIENSLKINKQIMKELSVQKVKSQLNGIKWANIIELLFHVPFLVFLFDFFISHSGLFFKYAIPALVLILFSIVSIIFCSLQLIAFFKIDSSNSVIQTQRRIEKLRYYEALEHNALYVIIPLIWTAFLIVVAKAVFNYDVVELGSWFIWNIIGSVFIALVIVFFLKKFPNENIKKSLLFLQQIDDLGKSD